jgi:hypothetical protein
MTPGRGGVMPPRRMAVCWPVHEEAVEEPHKPACHRSFRSAATADACMAAVIDGHGRGRGIHRRQAIDHDQIAPLHRDFLKCPQGRRRVGMLQSSIGLQSKCHHPQWR